MQPLKLLESRHPDKLAARRFDALIGIDAQKDELLFTLKNILDKKGMENWIKHHHSKRGLPYLEGILASDSMIILSGDVGCGKTELAHSIGTPLSKEMGDETIVLFETPSDIRTGGHVGELSGRVTSAFDSAKNSLRKGEYGILLIDEADDLATSRDQMQAHHEDRSGVNVLIKEIDKVQRDNLPLAVILITNRPNSIDPAVLRRASLHLKFGRPDESILNTLLEKVFEGVPFNNGSIKELAKACFKREIPYSYSDITNRIGKRSLIFAWKQNIPLTKDIILEIISKTEPSPIITETHKA